MLTSSQWIEGNIQGTEVSLAGSLGPALSLNELIDLSEDPAATTKALEFKDLKLAGGVNEAGGAELRQHIASLYDQSNVKVTADDVVSHLLTGHIVRCPRTMYIARR